MRPRRRDGKFDSRLLPVQSDSDVADRPASLRQQLASALQHDILTGVYAPGQRLIERRLVERFGVSSIPVREALQDLEGQGLLVKRPNVGCRVIDLTREEAGQICSLRRVLEPQVVRWAAERFTEEAEAALNERVAEMRAAAAAGDIAAFFHADLLFHKALWGVAGNWWASRALETALGSLFAAGLIAARRQGTLNLPDEAGKHQELVRLLRHGHVEAAAGQMADIGGRFETEVLPGMRSGDGEPPHAT